MPESALEKELRVNVAFDRMRRLQEAQMVAPDIIEWLEELQAEVVTLRHAVASLINQNLRRAMKEQKATAINGLGV